MTTPIVTHFQVIPVAGHDSMLLNLSGAHGPFFTRNIVILKDSSGNTGVGEVPGGERIRETLEDARSLVIGQPIGQYQRILNQMRSAFASRDAAGRGLQTRRPFPLRLRKAVVIGDKLCSGHRFTRCQRSPAHAAGAAQAVGFGIQAGLARAVQRLVHQLRAVAQQPHRLPRAFHKPAQGSGGRALVRA